MASSLQNLLFRTTRSLVCRPGATKDLGKMLKKTGSSKVFLVTDPMVRKLGLIDGAVQSLQAEGVALHVYDDVVADPPYTIIEAAAAAAKEYGADHIVGLGGGSSMDTAKLVACLAEPRATQALDDMYGVDLVSGSRLPLTLIPTTAGTGSEVTMNSIVTATKPGEEPMKKGVVSEQLLPDTAILDAELTLGLPPVVTADTGVDAMVHAIEAFTTKMKKNPVSDCLAKEALRILSRNLRIVTCDNPKDIQARSNMLLGACLAGMAFNNAPVGAVHALAYPLGSHFHVTHGLSNSLLLPHVLDFNRKDTYAAGLYAELAPCISEKLEMDQVGGGVPQNRDAAKDMEASAAVVQEIHHLLRDLNMKTKMTQMNIKPEDVGLLTTEAMKQTRLLPNNVRDIGKEDIQAIYTAAL